MQDALGVAGMLDVGAVTVLPVATGMALTLTLLAMKAQRPATARQDSPPKDLLLDSFSPGYGDSMISLTCLRYTEKRNVCMHRYVLWPRIDQKTCLKAIVSANLEVVPLENVLEGDELHTDMAAMRQEVDRLGPDSIVCIVTTTSCFAPRAADSVVEVAKLCKSWGFGHIINNAYGVQSAALCSLVSILRLPSSLPAHVVMLESATHRRHHAGGTCCVQ